MATKNNTPTKASPTGISVETLNHADDTRKNIPTAEYQSVMKADEQGPVPVKYPRHRAGTGGLEAEKGARNHDLDPQLVWRGKDAQDWSDLVVHAPPLYIQEKVHPKVLIDDLKRQTEQAAAQKAGFTSMGETPDLFADFNGLPSEDAKTEFYQHDAHWANRMILGDSLAVMASLAEREGLRGKVQCIYFDPPYGIKFNSNFQWSTTSRDVKDGNAEHITREPEQVKAFRDTWKDGIHSYLTYLRDRLTIARDLLTESGSVFVQIGEENCHLIRSLLDEVFGPENFISQIIFTKTASATSEFLGGTYDVIVLYAKVKERLKYRQPYTTKQVGGAGGGAYKKLRLSDLSERPLTRDELAGRDQFPSGARVFRIDNLTSQSVGRDKGEGAASWFPVNFQGRTLRPSEKVRWKTNELGMSRLLKASRLSATSGGLYYVRYFEDFAAFPDSNVWTDTGIAGFASEKRYVVETSEKVVQRCLTMVTDPGDLVIDPTCGSGTTAFVAELGGRRWITIDTSRVALALARARIMGARYPYYLLADSRDGQIKEAEVTRSAPSSAPTRGNVRQGFVYERVPHITLKSIANNVEIDVIYDKHQALLEPLRQQLNQALGKSWQEWEVPRDINDLVGDGKGFQKAVFAVAPSEIRALHQRWWDARIARQQEIDASIAAKAEFEFLYDKPYEDRKKVRVAGPFTVESLSPHRVLTVDEDDELVDGVAEQEAKYSEERDFARIILDNLKTAGVQQAHKGDKITFTSLTPWPGELVCAEGRYIAEAEGAAGEEKRAAIFIGPEFGTVSRPDLVAAAREAGDAGFDVLIACAFNYDARSTEFDKLGRIPVLKARMNADLHMAEDLKNTGKGNLFVIFGEPDIDVLPAENDQVRIKVSFRDSARLILVDEETIISKTSPIRTGQYTTGTAESAVFRLLLTGVDDSSLISSEDPKVAKGRQAGKVEMLALLLSQTKGRMAEMQLPGDAQAWQGQLAQIEALFEAAQKELAVEQQNAVQLEGERRAELSGLRQLESRSGVLRELQRRFALLEQQYLSDLRRLESIAEAGARLGQMNEERCPVCGATAEHQEHEHQNAETAPEDVAQSCLAEAAKIRLLISDLHLTRVDNDREIARLDDLGIQARERVRAVATQLTEMLRPRVEVALLRLREGQANRDTYRRALELHGRANELQGMVVDLRLAAPGKGAELESARVRSDEAETFSQEVESLLRAWHFPGLERVTFSESDQDIVISGRTRASHGKGVRAIAHAAFNLALLKSCLKGEMPHPGFVLIDSPPCCLPRA